MFIYKIFMKKFLLLCSVFVFSLQQAQLQSQDEKKEYDALLKREQRHFSQMLNNNVNPNTLNYDLRYQRVEMDLDPAIYNVQAKITSHFKTNQALSSLYFDLNNQLTVSSVMYKGQSIAFQQLVEEIKIDFPTTIANNTLDSLSISYSGQPSGANQSFTTTTTNAGNPVLYTLSEPYGAKDWWPTKQSMNDKIEKLDIKITTPNQYSVASNGKLISETTLNNGKKLSYWQTNYPIPAYLFALGITNYTKINTQIGPAGNQFPFMNYMYPESASIATNMTNINWTNEAMILYEDNFGLYPYRNEKYGHMQFGWSGGMEHATMSSMGGWGKTLIAHELAHQWFGDKITCGKWNDVWLNEGFATYGEHLVLENLLNTPTQFKTYLQGQKDYICNVLGGSVYVADANLNSIGALFSSRLSYAKGGYVVRMIRWILGDANFKIAIKNYTSQAGLAYGYAVTNDLKNSLLTTSGKDFTEFFNDWIYGQGYPTYTIRWKQNPATNGFNIKVSQTQSHSSVSYYEMPIPIRVKGASGQVMDLVYQNNQNNQQFYSAVPFAITSVEFDPDLYILSKNNTIILDNTLQTEEQNINKNIQVYPNPVKNELQISGLKQNANYQIIAADGKLVKTGTYQPNDKISVIGMSKGLYIIQINHLQMKWIKE